MVRVVISCSRCIISVSETSYRSLGPSCAAISIPRHYGPSDFDDLSGGNYLLERRDLRIQFIAPKILLDFKLETKPELGYFGAFIFFSNHVPKSIQLIQVVTNFQIVLAILLQLLTLLGSEVHRKTIIEEFRIELR